MPPRIPIITREPWMEFAACRGLDPELFFPEPGGVGSNQALVVCHDCPVRSDCDEYATRKHERLGIWGGRTARSRRVGKSKEEDLDDVRDEGGFDG